MSKEVAPLFKILDSINFSKEDILEEVGQKEYKSFSINRFLSGSIDTVIFANEMNIRHQMPVEMQYDYLRFSIRKKKRFSKWFKKKIEDDIELLMGYYKINYDRAKETRSLLTDEQVEAIRKKTEIGGIRK
jgi:signal recognition particle receptor subunit beta